MHLVTVIAPNVRPRPDPYTVTAEFYDILQADEDETLVRRLYGPAVARARQGVLDIGAGTGRVTLMSLAESGADVHAVEPSRAMRTVLTARLAALPAARDRATLYPHPLDEAALYEVADVAVCHNTVACLSPAARRALWPSIGAALSPGGSLLLHLPPARLPARDVVRIFPERRIGRHEYGGRMVMSAVGGRIRARAHYWVRAQGCMLQEHTETFWMWPASRSALVRDLERHGFTPSSGPTDAAVLAMTLRSGLTAGVGVGVTTRAG
ncbi:methyltransferase family protein [Streptomyces sp. 840.1]|uniref:class I SAM-dependent methyltransferase n=1 Tax=Streptomyces sp. 840.1 TaxID=2485152 RepID=UPI000F4618B0|nr:class I SAM-dependent methyltransferase [Streptomyces sp. 840.1]ROQ60169.1 methyltransferase family protein [Streptomyces sp. 840.1]